jgi:hypothetical protein
LVTWNNGGTEAVKNFIPLRKGKKIRQLGRGFAVFKRNISADKKVWIVNGRKSSTVLKGC